ncbi:MAG: DNA gyrase subunit A [Myxococcales bacterium]|nr:DNA gyrase subunit A [Myxococcales bacterium]
MSDNPESPNLGTITPVNIEDEMRTSYVDYAMSVIIGRAIPDVRDGLKPVHRRVLFAMHEQKNNWNGPYKKSARIVGDVIGKYHPHGDQAAYDTLVRLAQDFAMRYPLVDGQGNFGSIDGDSAAAMRYTEVRMTRLAHELLADLEKNTVDFAPNYDGSMKEPTVLPARFPQLLVNGSAGIAVGMATNIPPHNLTEVINGTIALIRDSSLGVEGLMEHIKGPDFPTSGFMFGKKGLVDAYTTGRGSVRMRAKIDVEETKQGRHVLVVTELPYQTNKARLIERIASLVQEKRLEGISDIRDESDRHGMRIVILLKRDATPEVVQNQLFAHTNLQGSFALNMLAIVNGQPRCLGLKDILSHFIDHRRDVVTRRCRYELKKAEDRHHILKGYNIALDNIDEVIATIRGSKDSPEAKIRLVGQFAFSEIQAQAILDLRLHRLTGMERDKILEELREVEAEMERLKGILGSDELLMNVVVEELEDIRERYGDARRTVIIEADLNLDYEDLIPDDDAVVTISHTGYIKRMPVSLFQSQRRGGKGKVGAKLRDEDVLTDVFHTTLHTQLLIFTNFGKVYKIKVYQVTPTETGRHRGKPIVQMIPVAKEEKVCAVLPIRSYEDYDYMFFSTAQGHVKKTPLAQYESIRSNGKIAISLNHGDDLVRVLPIRGDQELLLSTQKGLSIRFPEDKVRPMGRSARGVIGIRLRKDDKVVSAESVEEGITVLSVTTNGYGKRSNIDEYRVQNRGGKGIITIQCSDRNGPVVAALQVEDDDDLLLVTDGGQMIRIRAKEIRVIGRNTQGVKLFDVPDTHNIVAVERIVSGDDDEESGEEVDGEAVEAAEGAEAPAEEAESTDDEAADEPAEDVEEEGDENPEDD